MLRDALSYPRRDNSWRTVVIGGLLTFFWWIFFVPIFIVSGYSVHVLRSSALGEAEAPRFDDWGHLLVDGLKAFVIYFAYGSVPFLIAFVALSGTMFEGGVNGGAVAIVDLPQLIALVSGVLIITMAALIPIALTNFALEDRLGAAFEFRTIVNAATTGDYIKAVLSSILIGVLGSVVFLIGVSIYTTISTEGYWLLLEIITGTPDPTPDRISTLEFVLAVIDYVGMAVVASFVGLYVLMAIYHLLGQECATALVDDSSSSLLKSS
ncbi:DUF4013 domain-containing protein [Halocatena marina]|uniref:DUF4013 domain-containing protein n=1 Tax=Halocatena marina TaxID=2934937 RepID=A0ABD5YTM3_9EURY|nr:DUF4013 domain-containing protein [Halocatena marina]